MSLIRAVVVSLLLVALSTPPAAAQAPTPTPTPSSSLQTTGDAAAVPLVPFVPVRGFWSNQRDIPLKEIVAAIEGRSERFSRVVVATHDADALWASMGVEPAETTTAVETVQQVKRRLRRSKRTLGLVPAARVHTSLRALRVDGRDLFGRERIGDLSDWPLTGTDAGDHKPFDPSKAWTLVVGGDVMLDREPHRQSMILGKGPDYVWNGGVAEIASRTCCTVDGGPAITTERVAGTRGAVRELLSDADLAVVNFEAPVPNEHRYHPSGLVFNVDPEMLSGVADAGIDAVSLANNHIRNAGSKGVAQTVRNLRKAGIKTFGAGPDPERAHRPLCFDRAGARVCFLGYNDINTELSAVSASRAGAASLDDRQTMREIRQLRRAGADTIIVWPHWGREYTPTTRKAQHRLAREMVAAGADLVLGNHSHVVGPVEFISGAPVLYSLGNLIFDLPRFESTEEGVLAEITFLGARPMQLELHPTVVHERAQLHLLERDGDGKVVIERMREASGSGS